MIIFADLIGRHACHLVRLGSLALLLVSYDLFRSVVILLVISKLASHPERRLGRCLVLSLSVLEVLSKLVPTLCLLGVRLHCNVAGIFLLRLLGSLRTSLTTW